MAGRGFAISDCLLSGWVADMAGGYNMAFLVGGSISLCACVFLCVAEVIYEHCHCKSSDSYSIVNARHLRSGRPKSCIESIT